MRPVGLWAVVESMGDMLRRLLGEDVELVLRAAGPAPMVSADAGQIEQVIMNLAVNARDAMPKGGRLTIETGEVLVDGPQKAGASPPKGDYVLLSVADTGAGMSRDVLAHAFEPFFTTKELGKGTGLGLATVYGIVKQHRGHIFVDSEPGKGSTFRIYLPVGSAGAALVPTEAPQALPRGTETVLLVEDEEPIRALVADVLRSQGYRVLAAASGEEALAAGDAALQGIDLLLTDIVLPGVNGRELADALRRKRRDLRVLYMSGHSRDILARKGLLDQGEAMIHKPLTTGSLVQAVRRTLDLTV
jgi:CheY-like chemotaxis protein